MAAIDLEELLRATVDDSTISLCFGALGMNVGGLALPGNLLLPDVIRQQWNAPCAGSMKMSPASTTFRIFTNRASTQLKIFSMGASINSKLFNLYKSLNIVELPITLTALGSDTINIPALPSSLNMGDDGLGNWGFGTSPNSVPFEFDFREAGSFPTATGRRVQFNIYNLPLDEERVRMGIAANPDFGDPNRIEPALHSGQFYILGEELLLLGARAGAAGLVPFQLKAAPQIDDAQFTVFQRMNSQTKAFNNEMPWGTSSTDSEVISEIVRGLPSTSVDPDVNWAAVEYGLVGIALRGFVEPYDTSGGAAAFPASVSGSTAVTMTLPPLETIAGQTRGLNDWMPTPEVTDPTHPAYMVGVQADNTRGWPINRNGQIVPVTTLATHRINFNGSGARYFTLRNPATNVTARRADMYELTLTDITHIANSLNDPVRGQPDNALWKIYGSVGGQATLTVTLPFVMPRRTTLGGTLGVVPDPLEAANFVGQKLTWSIAEHLIDTAAGSGLGKAFNYQSWAIDWLFDNSYMTSSDSHEFYWQ
jgi:hypothetical protein